MLPQSLTGYPDPGVKNWLPRIVNHLGLRSSAVRAGFSVQHGIVTSKWFAEQVSLPVSAWNFPPGQPRVVPNLALSSGEFSSFPEAAPALSSTRIAASATGTGATGSPLNSCPRKMPPKGRPDGLQPLLHHPLRALPQRGPDPARRLRAISQERKQSSSSR